MQSEEQYDESEMEQPRGFRIGSIAGTQMYVEIGFLILIGLFVILALEQRTPIERALLWIPILFFSILLHEVGHALTISLFGYGRSQIFLTAFGGVTINRRRARPLHDIVISAAGPLASVAIWFLMAVIWRNFPVVRHDPMLMHLIPLAQWANGAWAIFNLMPVFPLDGGSIFFNLARIFTTERRAAAVSIWSSIIVAALLIFFAIRIGALFLGIIAAILAFQNYQRWSILRSAGRDE